MLLIADLADGGAAVDVHLADLAGAQPDLRVVALAREQLHRGAGGARELRALAGKHLDAMDGGSDRDVLQRQGIAGLDRRLRPGDELHARGNALGRDDVAPFAVSIEKQGEKRAAVGIVLEALDLRRNGVLVALEIDDAIALLVSAALVAHGDLAVDVAARFPQLALDQVRYRLALVEIRIDDLDDLALAGCDGSPLDQHYLGSAWSAKL